MQQLEYLARACDIGAFDRVVAVSATVPRHHPAYAACQSIAASAYRQVGRHDVAISHDLAGLAGEQAEPTGAAMCRLGLVADHVGLAGAGAAAQSLAEAQDAVAGLSPNQWSQRWLDPWRTLAWVAAEVGLLADRPSEAVQLLRPWSEARPPSRPGPRWAFYCAKTLLFLGVSLHCEGSQAEAVSVLARAAEIAIGSRLAPLIGPAAERLASVAPELAQPLAGDVRAAAAFLARHAPPGP